MEFVHIPPEISVIATTTTLITVLLFLYYFLTWKKTKSDNNTTKPIIKPPQPSNKWPIIGHLHLLKGLPHISLGKLADKYGPIFMINLGVERVLVVSKANMVKACLGDNNNKDAIFLNRPHKLFINLQSAMLPFSPYGEYWRQIRKILTVELLSNRRIEMFKSLRISQVRSAIKEISGFGSNESIDMKQWFNDISMNIIVRLVSGKSLKEMYQGEEYIRCTKVLREFFELAGVFVPGDLFPYLRWFDIGGHEKRIKKVAKDMDDFAQRWLEEHKQRKSSIVESDVKKDFIDVMLGIFKDGQEMPFKFSKDTIIKATCMALILAATDTTAVTLTWALSLLLNNKEALKKTQVELDNFIGKERIVQESDLENLVYLQAVLKETMRLYPAAPLSVPREAISDSTVSGYHIPVGTQLFVNLYKIHRDPQVFEDPLSFNPERFLTNCKDYDVRGQNYEYMPFGSGRRICPGISFAHQMMQLTLASLLHGFEISNASGETVDMTEGFGLTNLKVTPLDVVLTHRLPRHLYHGR